MVQVVGNLGSAPIGMALAGFGIRWTAGFGVIGTVIGFALVAISTGIRQIVIPFGILIALADMCIGVASTSYLVSHWFQRRSGLSLGLSVLGALAAAILSLPTH